MSKETSQLPKVVVILGPTASGKSDWAIRLAKDLTGEIISADSRQIFKKMDIGTAKEMGEWRWDGIHKTYFVNDIPHYLIDIIDPGKQFSVADFRDRAVKSINIILKKGRVPIIAGGTGLYIQAVVDNLSIPRVPANKKLRQSLEEKSNEDLLALLKTLDPDGAETIDSHNKRRVIRALEVCIMSGEAFSKQQLQGEPLFDFLLIGIDVDRVVLHERISKRIDTMVELGLVEEIKGLLRQKYSWALSSMSGIGYKQFRGFLEGEIGLHTAIDLLKRDTRRFARRQLTWFRRDKRIKWCRDYEEAEKLVKEFLELE